LIIDFDIISKVYDSIREADTNIVNLLVNRIKTDGATNILDFGCGTGNYIKSLRKSSDLFSIYGVDPSKGMRKIAIRKNKGVQIKDGNHIKIPFSNSFFDFIYMTDVIHLVGDINVLFLEISRVLKVKGVLAVLTLSYDQIERKYFAKYFPSSIIINKKRYPSIEIIKNSAQNCNINVIRIEICNENTKIDVNCKLFDSLHKKGYSILRLIPEDEYKSGLQQLERDLSSKNHVLNSGKTLIWFQKSSE